MTTLRGGFLISKTNKHIRIMNCTYVHTVAIILLSKRNKLIKDF